MRIRFPKAWIYVLLISVASIVSADTSEWSEREIRLLYSLSLNRLGPPPPVPSNKYANNSEAATFGKRLFFDTRLSGNQEISCATCHKPELHFTDGVARSRGAGEVMRNSPSLIGVAYNRWFYWDGRRDSLWAQALIPFEAQDEMGSNRVAVLRLIAMDDSFSKEYAQIFGSEISIDFESIPENAGPFGNDDVRNAWSSLSHEQQQAINAAFANIGKAIAAYERTLLPSPAKFDRYVAGLQIGEPEVEITASEIAGARLFLNIEKTQCLQCHNGPLLTNGEFHNIGSGNFSGKHLDFGRSIGLRAVMMDEFNCLGPYSDAQQQECRELLYLNMDSHLPLRGAFKVPSLRSLERTGPYFHDGRFETLREVLQFYNAPPSPDIVGPHELRPMNMSEDQLSDLEAFLRLLSN